MSSTKACVLVFLYVLIHDTSIIIWNCVYKSLIRQTKRITRTRKSPCSRWGRLARRLICPFYTMQSESGRAFSFYEANKLLENPIESLALLSSLYSSFFYFSYGNLFRRSTKIEWFQLIEHVDLNPCSLYIHDLRDETRNETNKKIFSDATVQKSTDLSHSFLVAPLSIAHTRDASAPRTPGSRRGNKMFWFSLFSKWVMKKGHYWFRSKDYFVFRFRC